MQYFLSELIAPILTVLIATFTAILLLKKYKESSKLPPGPWGLPIVGYFPMFNAMPHLTITELSKKYGNIFSVKLGPENVVFLNDLESTKDAMSKDEFLARPYSMKETGMFRSERNIVTESGQFWREQRRFAFRTFRDLGFGKQVMESNIKDEISHFIKEIERRRDNPVDVHPLLAPSVSNNICYLLFGHRYDYDDPKRQYFDMLTADVPTLINSITLIGLIPLIKNFLRIVGSSQTKKTLGDVQKFEDLIDQEIEEHKKNLETGDTKDYIDGYLQEMMAREKKNDVGSFTVDVINSNARVFFVAGSETVRTTILWLLKLIAVHRDIQKRIQNEVDAVIGNERTPSWSDRERMPFTQAVLLEAQRWASVIALNIPRRTLTDAYICGHLIPKDTVVIANFWAMNRDPNLWQTPEKFNPNHFLSKDGKVINEDLLNVFSYGKRACVGESLANFQLFLYFTTLMQKYTIEMPNGVEPNFEARLGINLQPVQRPVLNFIKRRN